MAEKDYFITTWQTTTNNESITIPTSGSGYNYTVDWGDGTIDTNITGNATHTYTTPGIYTVKIDGDFPRIHFSTSIGNRDKILTIEQWGTIKWETMYGAFQGCSKLTSNAIDTPDLSLVTDMTWMFWNATSFNGDLSKWDVSTINKMRDLFRSAQSFNSDLSNWDVSKVNQTLGMFKGASIFNSDLSNWNLSNVTTMQDMFDGATSFNSDLSNWNVSKVTSMQNMLRGVTLSKENYDALLIGWSQLDLQPNVKFHGGFSNYCAGATARASIIEKFNWEITDGRQECPITIYSSHQTLPADGTSTATITVQLKDNDGNNITTGDATVVISTTEGTISPTTNNNNGTYTAILTAPMTTTPAIISCTVDGEEADQTTGIKFTPFADINRSTITADPTRIDADGISMTTITVQLKDAEGNSINIPNVEVVIASEKGTITSTILQTDGTYQAILTAPTLSGRSLLTFTVNGSLSDRNTVVAFDEILDISKSTIIANPNRIRSNGTDTSIIEVQLYNKDSEPFENNGVEVEIITDLSFNL